MHRIALLAPLALLLAVSACSKKSEPTTPTGGGGGAAAAPMISETMADAPTHNVPATLGVQPPCNASGYMKLAVPAGTAFSIEAKVSAGSAMIDITDANGKSAGVSTEITAEAPKTVSSTGQEGATFVTVSETGACAGNTLTLDVK